MRIHYNVTGNERKALVKVIETTTGAKAVYMKMPTCAYEIDYFTVTKEGVLEFSDRSDSEEVEAVLEALAAARKTLRKRLRWPTRKRRKPKNPRRKTEGTTLLS